MQHPKISIIIPVWNAERYLRRCLHSVLGQTLRDIEIICVDDASTDRSLEILRDYAAHDARMRVVSLEKNSGESVARNTALAMAQGEYIGSVDNDDAVDVDFFEKLYGKAHETGADIVKGDCIIRWEGKVEPQKLNDLVKKHKFHFSWQWWSAIYRTSLLRDNTITFPENLCLGGDIVFLVQAISACQSISIIDDVLYHYHRRSDSGDAQILTIDKVHSVLQARKMTCEYLNVFYSHIPREIYCHHFYDTLFYIIKNISERHSGKTGKRSCAEALFALHDMCKEQDFLNMKIYESFPAIYYFLHVGDRDALASYLSVVHATHRKKLNAAVLRKNLVSDLRERIEKHVQ